MIPSRVYALRCLQASLLQFTLSEGIVILGRSRSCDWVVSHASVSRRHAEIRSGEKWVDVVDLDSSHGTFIGEVRINTRRLIPGEIVRFGRIAFALYLDEESRNEETIDPVSAQEERLPHPRQKNSLSAAQQRVFQLLLKGHSEKAIAKLLILSTHTIHNHTRAIFRAFAVHSRAQLLANFTH
jgi:pSer/pThr/pTyr-binding forkhead associated (FHA) protein